MLLNRIYIYMAVARPGLKIGKNKNVSTSRICNSSHNIHTSSSADFHGKPPGFALWELSLCLSWVFPCVSEWEESRL